MPALIHVVFTATPDQKVGNGVYAGDSYCSLACLAKGALRIPLPEHEDVIARQELREAGR